MVQEESGSVESQLERCLLMSGQESVVMEAMSSEFLLGNGPAISFQIVDKCLCWTCRAFGSRGCLSVGVACNHS